MERINYHFAERDAVFESLRTAGKVIVEDVMIDLDAQGVPQTCYFLVISAADLQPDLLAAADERILELEYENLLLKGGFDL